MVQILPNVHRGIVAPGSVTRLVAGAEIHSRIAVWREFVARQGESSLNYDPEWLLVLADGRQHVPFCVEASAAGQVTGLLPLALVEGPFFGRFLVGLPYLSSGGACCQDDETAVSLVDRAVALADELHVQFLELRHERPIAHPALQRIVTDKVHMRLPLAREAESLWRQRSCKVRNQVRKAERQGFCAAWGGMELLDEFLAVYSRRMRELGTPIDGRAAFASILSHFPQQAELCVVREGPRPVAGALLLHGSATTEVIRSAALSELRSTAINTWLYWQALLRAQERGSSVFDLGRPTLGSSVFTFKKRLGAMPHPSAWQHYVRHGSPAAMRRTTGKYDPWIQLWRCLPLPLTGWIGPTIARGIP